MQSNVGGGNNRQHRLICNSNKYIVQKLQQFKMNIYLWLFNHFLVFCPAKTAILAIKWPNYSILCAGRRCACKGPHVWHAWCTVHDETSPGSVVLADQLMSTSDSVQTAVTFKCSVEKQTWKIWFCLRCDDERVSLRRQDRPPLMPEAPKLHKPLVLPVSVQHT